MNVSLKTLSAGIIPGQGEGILLVMWSRVAQLVEQGTRNAKAVNSSHTGDQYEKNEMHSLLTVSRSG